MIRSEDIPLLLKSTFGFVANKAVSLGEVTSDYSGGYRVRFELGGQHFIAFIDDREMSHSTNASDATKALGAPFMAIDKLYKDGVAEGRKRERDEEIRMLRTKQENAYRALRHKAMADAWSAIAKGGAA